jgi:hypothetical protein
MTYDVSGTYSKLLLIHYIIVHFLTEYPALIEEPCLLTSTDIGGGVAHVVVPCDFGQECESATNFVVDLFVVSLGPSRWSECVGWLLWKSLNPYLLEHGRRRILVKVLGTVRFHGSHSTLFREVRYRDDFKPRSLEL